MAEIETELGVDESSMAEENPPSELLSGSNGDALQHQTPEELVARGIAPVKKEFLRPPPSRNGEKSASSDAAESKQGQGGLVKEKKSKRQIKRERQQELKSALRLCAAVSKSGDSSSCQYGDKCRFSHDIEAFKALKPKDLEGECPFLSMEGRCPYGLACRFLGTHKDVATDGHSDIKRRTSELNEMSKDVQRLLWKHKYQFTKADEVLKSLGLMGPNAKKKKLEAEDEDQILPENAHAADGNGSSVKLAAESGENGECIQKSNGAENADETCATDELRPSKKAKSADDENHCGEEVKEDAMALEKDSAETKSVPTTDDVLAEPDKTLKIHPREKKLIDFRGKLYLAPLTTVGNLPFRRLCKVLGADVTCGEMAMCTNLVQGQASEWALLRRHPSEDLFGVQICGSYPDTITRTVELIDAECTVDFIDINMGCPIDLVCNKGAGSCLLTKPTRMKSIIQAASMTVETPITLKVRTGYFEGKNRIDSLIADMGNWGATAITVHGRTRQQRYSKAADWGYIYQCAQKAPDSLQVVGNGDVCSFEDWHQHLTDCPQLSSSMIARGALAKPWIFTEIKERRHWDITSGERLNILKDYARFGLEHWGSDSQGVEKTRYFLLEWLSYTCRYIPIGLLDVIPQRLNWRPPSFCGRDDLETLMASESAADWIRISEMLLGKVPDGFTFAPKHKSSAYDKAENG